jgi:hypothetical protein
MKPFEPVHYEPKLLACITSDNLNLGQPFLPDSAIKKFCRSQAGKDRSSRRGRWVLPASRFANVIGRIW